MSRRRFSRGAWAAVAVGLLALVVVLAWASSALRPAIVDVQILAFNDFHGRLEPPSGSGGRVGEATAGGVEYLAAHIARLRATNPHTLVVSAGDNIGATPILSGLFHDEPSIEALNALGLQVSAVGNHELDEGWWELRRMAHGGCHPVDGCQDGTPYAGAEFEFLAANVIVDPTRVPRSLLVASGLEPRGRQALTLFPPSTVKTVGGVKVGFIGLTLQGTPAIVPATSLTGLTFQPEAAAASAEAARLRQRGVGAVVVLIHEGGVQGSGADPSGCADFGGPIKGIVEAMSADIDVVVSGHTHKPYVCELAGKLLTSADYYSRMVTDIDLRIDRATGRVVGKQARNVVVTRDVPVEAAESDVIAHYRPLAAEVADRPVGTLLAPVSREEDPAGQTPIGALVADSMLEASTGPARGNAQIALVNAGGVRADLARPATAVAGQPSPITYSDVVNILPFGNAIVVMTLTGEALARWLEEQFTRVESGWTMLQVSRGFSYTFDPSQPAGQWVDRASLAINGVPVAPTDRVRVASVDFLWGGGDGFTVVREATEPTQVGDGLEAFIAFLKRHSPVTPVAGGRVQRR